MGLLEKGAFHPKSGTLHCLGPRARAAGAVSCASALGEVLGASHQIKNAGCTGYFV